MKILNIKGGLLFASIMLLACQQLMAQDNGVSEEKYKLKNKLQVVFLNYGNIPVTYVSLIVNTGTKNETPGMQSIASLTANSLLLGNKKYSREQQDSLKYVMAAELAATSNDNFTDISMQFLNQDADNAMDLFSNVILHPAFPKDEVANYIDQQLTYNNPAKMDIGDLGNIYSRFFVYGASNPLGRTFYAAQLNKISADQVNEFYKFNYTPKNCILVICGSPDKDKMKALIEQEFGGWEASYSEVNGVSLPDVDITQKEYAFVNRDNTSQAALYWVKKAPDIKSKDLAAFEIANGVLSEMLFNQIRVKEGKTYGIGSSFDPHANNGIYTVSTQVRSEVMFATLESFDKVLKQFYDSGAPKDIFTISKMRLEGSLNSIESPGQLVALYNPLLYPDFEKRKQMLAEVSTIDIDRVNKVIKKYFNPDSYKVMITGNAADLKPQLDKIPGLKTLPVAAIEVDD